GPKVKARFAGWSRDDSGFYVLTNERDPHFFDAYRYDAGDYGRTLIYQDREGYQVGDISGDGRWIALDKPKSTADGDIYLWDVRDQKLTHVTPHDAPAQYRTAEFDPDSKALYYLTNAGGEFARLRRLVLDGGVHEDIESADWDILSA